MSDAFEVIWLGFSVYFEIFIYSFTEYDILTIGLKTFHQHHNHKLYSIFPFRKGIYFILADDCEWEDEHTKGIYDNSMPSLASSTCYYSITPFNTSNALKLKRKSLKTHLLAPFQNNIKYIGWKEKSVSTQFNFNWHI